MNRQANTSKKNKTPPPHKKTKILCRPTLHTFAFACHRTKPTQRQSQKSAIANALLNQSSKTYL